MNIIPDMYSYIPVYENVYKSYSWHVLTHCDLTETNDCDCEGII